MTQISDEEWQKMSPEERMNFQISNCIFCKIIKGEIPSKKIFEDSDFLGVLDINPGTKGHVLVLSKKHVQIMPQLGTELNGKLGVVTKTISNKIIKSLGVKGTSVFVANGAVAGQNAPHFMMHVIPRKDDDNINLDPSLKKIDEQKIFALRQKIISSLGLLTPENENKINNEVDNKNNDDNIVDRIKANNEREEKKEIIEKKETQHEEKSNEVDKDLLDKIAKMFD